MEGTRPLEGAEGSEPPAEVGDDKIPSVRIFDKRPRSRDFDREIFPSEGGYLVEFSNQGGKHHENPNPPNLRKRRMTCLVSEDGGCENVTDNQTGLCSDHNYKKGRPRVILIHWADWIGRIIPPGRRREDCLTWAPAHLSIIERFVVWTQSEEEQRQPRLKKLDGFVSDLMSTIKGNTPDSTTLQRDLESSSGAMAAQVVSNAREVVNRNFPSEEYASVSVGDWSYKPRELDESVKLGSVPIRTMAALLFLGVASEEANRGDLWTYLQCGRRQEEAKRASVYMPMAYYYLRAHLGATKNMATQSVRQPGSRSLA